MDRHRRSSRVSPGSGAGLLLLLIVLALGASGSTAALAPAFSAAPSLVLATTTPTPVSSATALPSGSLGVDPVTAVLVGAGDIADCDGDNASGSVAAQTAALVAQIPGTVFAAGDEAYEDGSPSEFEDCYDPTWGAFKDRTLLPAIGNHEYGTPGGAGYYNYFGGEAGTPGDGWYSRDIGGWHIVVLNGNCTVVGCGPDSPQVEWLKSDLAAHPAECTLAIWHQPLFSSGFHRDGVAVKPFWDALWAAHADLVINGHDHDYERFAPQDPDGHLDLTGGIREIVVGTGGAPLRPFVSVDLNREVANDQTHGVIVLSLHAASYDWRFVPVAGETFADAGSATCH